jgi:hypothetical protein
VLAHVAESRKALREFLTDLLVGLELDEPTEKGLTLTRVLQEAVDGLDRLDQGETPPIFASIRAQRQKANPVQIRRLKINALVHADALRRLKHKDSLTKVAKAFYRDVETLRTWQKNLKKGPFAQELKQALHVARMVEGTSAMWGMKPTVDGLLALAARDGDRLRALEAKSSAKGG